MAVGRRLLKALAVLVSACGLAFVAVGLALGMGLIAVSFLLADLSEPDDH